MRSGNFTKNKNYITSHLSANIFTQRFAGFIRLFKLTAFALIVYGITPTKTIAQAMPAGFTQTKIASLLLPMGMAAAPDGRFFICEKYGVVKVFKNGAILETPALTEKVNQWGERGMLSIAIDPNFTINKFIYVYYSTLDNSRNVLRRYKMEGDVAVDPFTLLELDPLVLERHMGGGIAFGKDGKIYLGSGENSQGDRIQKLDNTFGKILRINPDGSVPSDNPYVNSSGINKYIWSVGVRNPYTLSIQPETGKVYFTDFGDDLETGWEDIHDATMPSQNFGWPIVEGNSSDPKLTDPVYTYKTFRNPDPIKGCGISGGTFFNPTATNYPASYFGKYFFVDYCNRWINYIDPNAADISASVKTFASEIPTSANNLIVGPDGNFYFLTIENPGLYKISYSASSALTINSHPDNSLTPEGQKATFRVSASGSGKISYQWMKEGVDIAGANSFSYSINNIQKADEGEYNVRVSNGSQKTVSAAAVLSVSAPNNLPVPTIASPTKGVKYNFGDEVTFTGSATDKEDGDLPSSSLTWRYYFIHGTHAHPMNTITGVTTGSFKTDFNETATDVGYRIVLTATDSKGQTASTSIDILPNLSSFTVSTVPLGLQIKVDQTIKDAPLVLNSVVNQPRHVETIDFLKSGNNFYEFTAWNHGGTSSQTITTASTPELYTAVYKQSANLALNKPVASSTGPASKTSAKNAVDGNPATGWSLGFEKPQWVYVDLEDEFNIRAVNVQWLSAAARAYKIQVSVDAVNWFEIKDVTENKEKSNSWEGFSNLGRYVRIYSNIKTTEVNYSIGEIQVYGTPDKSGVTNVALYKPTKASSVEDGHEFTPNAFIVDGKQSTRWSSLAEDVQWVSIDLQQEYLITGVKIFWEVARAKDYKIQVSTDGVKWEDIKVVKDNQNLENSLTGLTGSGRYVRMLGSARGTKSGYSIYEFEVHGTPKEGGKKLAISE